MLRAFDAGHPVLDVRSIAERAGLPLSTTYRLLAQWQEAGLIERSGEGRFRLGLGLWEIGSRVSGAESLASSALPFLEDVNQVVRHSVQLSILDGAEVLILERLARPGHAANPAGRASRLPVHRSSAGLVLLAYADPGVMRAYEERKGRRAAELHPDLPGLLAEVRRQGFAILDGLIDVGTTGISVPVLDARQRAVAALSVVVPAGYPAESAVMSLRTASRGLARSLARDVGERRGPGPDSIE